MKKFFAKILNKIPYFARLNDPLSEADRAATAHIPYHIHAKFKSIGYVDFPIARTIMKNYQTTLGKLHREINRIHSSHSKCEKVMFADRVEYRFYDRTGHISVTYIIYDKSKEVSCQNK